MGSESTYKYKSEATRHRENAGKATSDYEAWDNPTVKAATAAQESFFIEHIKQYTEFVSWAR